MLRTLKIGATILGLAAGWAVAAEMPAAGAPGSLEWAVNGDWRNADKPRDSVRHPVEELKFMGLQPSMTVVEIYPGGGYFTQILAPVLKQGGGKLIAIGGRDTVSAGFKEKFMDHPELYGSIGYGYLNDKAAMLAPAGSADLVVTFRNVHNWMGGGFADRAFADFYKVLKPGGLLGVEEHRANPAGAQDPKAQNGYVQEAAVKAMAAKAGFTFVKSSELLANPKDTKDYPFGVWTLPPTLQTAPEGQPANPAFDNAKYKAIGEADNMLLLFKKP